jgi:nucleoside-diphosphate-sugar epimerase
MKILFIGGTGNISSSVSRAVIEKGHDLYHLNRGKRESDFSQIKTFFVDIIDKKSVYQKLVQHEWDVVVNWIAFKKEDIFRDYEYFRGRTRQYIFISSASVYQKPPLHPYITESTPLRNPFWEYSRDKIACEEECNRLFRDHHFPITIVRPSLTYSTVIPVAIGSWNDFTIVDRMRKGKPVIIHGDGSSLWTITHADDFAKGFVGLLGHQQAIGHAFHITSDEILTWDQIYEDVAIAAGVPLNAIYIASEFISKVADNLPGWEWIRGNLFGDKAVSVVFDNSKIKQFVPGFSATIPFAQGIKRTVEWFEADPKRMVVDENKNIFMDKVIETYLKGKQK